MTQTLADTLNRPLRVGNRTVANRLVLAPMTYLGHIAYREVLEELGGCGLMFTEMCSAKTIPTENPRRSAHFTWRPAELPRLVCQIFGNDPSTMAQAAARIAAEGFFGVDINFGCAVAGICKRNCGAALLKDPPRAEAIVAAVRRAVKIPVWVKFRTGWEDCITPALELGRRFEGAGADALTFHPRVAPDRRARRPKWDYIRQLKTAVTIPVFGNGEVFTPADALQMLTFTRCDGIALGRMAIARPWLFSAWTQDTPPEETRDLYLSTALAILAATERYFPEPAALRRFRRFIQYFGANFKYGHTLNSRIKGAGDLAACKMVLFDFFKDPPQPLARPNLNLFI
ncbi:MAG: tRNA-dihydrouridine synthase family protein [Desulfobacterales bacterium]